MAKRRDRAQNRAAILLAAIFLAFALAGSAHAHPSLGSPESCATCSWNFHAPPALIAPVAVAPPPAPDTRVAAGEAFVVPLPSRGRPSTRSPPH